MRFLIVLLTLTALFFSTSAFATFPGQNGKIRYFNNLRFVRWFMNLKMSAVLVVILLSIANWCIAAPEAWWPEDGNLNDVAGGHNPSAANGYSFVPGKIGSGVSLASGGYIEISDSPDLDNQQFTVTGLG